MSDQENPTEDNQLYYSNQPIHQVMEQQVREMLERADLTEEQKQLVMISLQCPCCGSGGLSLSIPLKD